MFTKDDLQESTDVCNK